MLSRFWLVRRPSDSELPHVLIIGLDELGGDRVARYASFICPLDDLVIDIGEVLDEFNLISAELEISSDYIEHERAARMADVAIVVDGHAADIHTNGLRLERLKRLFFPCEAVVDREHGWL